MRAEYGLSRDSRSFDKSQPIIN